MTHPAHPMKLRVAVLAWALCVLISACDSPQQSAKSRDDTQLVETRQQLAAARIDLAKSRLVSNAADEALALLISALEADPTSEEARDMAAKILANTQWHLPETSIHHPLPIERIDFASPSEMWIGLAGSINQSTALNTMVKWNLAPLKIGSVLFPLAETKTRSLVLSPTRRSALIERAGVALLCDAQTLKPIRDIGQLPEFVTPPTTVTFSPNGLLLAHPAFVSETNHSLVWKIRDTASGEILRSSEPIPPSHSKPLAAFLDQVKLRVLHADGSLLDIPISPVEPITTTPAETALDLTFAYFSTDGGSALTLKCSDPHSPPHRFLMPFGSGDHQALGQSSLLERFPWSRHPGIWSGIGNDPLLAPIRVENNHVFFTGVDNAPIHTVTDITAIASNGDQIATGESDGALTLHRLLPLPFILQNQPKSAAFDDTSLAAFRDLTHILTGFTYQRSTRTCHSNSTDERIKTFKACNLSALAKVFPTLDFSPLVKQLEDFKLYQVSTESLVPLTRRLDRATEKLAHPEIQNAFDQADEKAIQSAITSAGPCGPAAAKALELALASTHTEWIEACLSNAKDLPPLLRKIALSRIAWLQDRKADAISGWPEAFPDLTQVRLREDWDGWESADFSQVLENLRLCVSEELDALVVSEVSTPKKRQAVIARLSDPLTLKAVGRERFANACLKAALALATFKEHSKAALKLAATARNLGESPAPCLRAEALSFTALGDYQKARDRWVTLITEHPIQDHVPGDYTEAAYTSFENADPQQAMAILTTGHHRFPNDANFALRAGWIALLTNNSEQAYRFLLSGRQIGYPPEKLENSLALLALAAAQSGATDDAAVFYQDLIRLAPAWKNPKTIDTLEWHDEMKDFLRRLVP